MSAVEDNCLEQKIAIVAGSCSGVGTAICERFIKVGADIHHCIVLRKDCLVVGFGGSSHKNSWTN